MTIPGIAEVFNPMFRLKAFFYYLVAVAMAGCVSTPVGNSPDATTASPTITDAVTASAGPAVQTKVATDIQLNPCVNLDEPRSLDDASGLTGTLFIERTGPSPSILLINAQDPSETREIERYVGDFVIGLSPRGAKLAYAQGTAPPAISVVVNIVSANGEVISRTVSSPLSTPAHPQYSGGWRLAKWLGDDWIFVHVSNASLKNLRPLVPAVLNLKSGEWERSLVDSLPNRHSLGAVAFSPDLTRALYVAGGEGKYSLALWDTVQSKMLWQKEGLANGALIGGQVGYVAWSSDSTKAAFTDGELSSRLADSLFIVDKNGENLRRLKSHSLTEAFLYSELNWSPDGRYLAAVAVSAVNSYDSSIVIYDSVSDQSVEMCRSRNEDILSDGRIRGPLSWSPDSRYLVFSSGRDILSENNAIQILNITSGEVTTLIKGPGNSFAGWSAVGDWSGP